MMEILKFGNKIHIIARNLYKDKILNFHKYVAYLQMEN